MKHLNKIFLAAGVAVAAMSFTACVGDIDLLPTDPRETTAGSFSEDPNKYMDDIFADVLLNFTVQGPGGNGIIAAIDAGWSPFQRCIWNMEETPSDEANWLSFPNDEAMGLMQFGIVNSATTAAIAGYYRFMVNIALCNDFIRSANSGLFAGADEARMRDYVNQARALRGACMYYMLTFYGDVPYVDDETEIGSQPAQLPRAEVFTLLAADLEKTVADMKEAKRPVQYGYVGVDMAQAYLVKLYLNAQVFSGQARWADAYKHAKEIIDRHQGTGFQNSGLANNYSQLFGQGNQKFTPGGGGSVQEILWSLPGRNQWIESWANVTMLIDGYLSDQAGCDALALNVKQGTNWKCISGRRQFVQKFTWNEPEMATSPDQRTRFWFTSKDGFTYENGAPLNQANSSKNGFLTIKYSNWVILDDGTIDQAASGEPIGDNFNTDFAVVRLAEIYLSAAEALINGAGSKDEALKYVNYIRNRANLPSWTSGQLTYESLQDERCRELYGEGVRRTDLIRYGKWISGYTWDWKGNVATGTDFNPNFNLYPLPAAIVTQAGYTQNPGY